MTLKGQIESFRVKGQGCGMQVSSGWSQVLEFLVELMEDQILQSADDLERSN